MDAHIKYLCHILFCQLCRIGKIRSFLSTDTTNKLAVSLILSRLDYCNSLLAGIPENKLNNQHMQNHAARLVLGKSRHASATTLLRTLHWLSVKARIQYKIACLCFQCIYQNSMPPYISDHDLHTVPLGRWALLTPLCWLFLVSLLRLTYLCPSLPVEHRPSTTPCHRTLFWASLVFPDQLVPCCFSSASASRLQLLRGRPLFLFPCGFQVRAWHVVLDAGFLSVCPI